MKTAISFAVAAGVVLAFAGSGSAQDWMVTPAPAVPLHVPLTPAAPPPAPATAAAPTVTPASPQLDRTPQAGDPIRRLLDPYGLSTPPASVLPGTSARPVPLPSFWVVVPWRGALAADRQPAAFDVSDRPAR